MRSIRVLILEDDASTALLFSAFLASLDDIEMIGTARDGVSGLEMIRRERPDLVLLDLVMPRMGGIEVLKALEREPVTPRPRVLVLSGIQDDLMVQKALRLGASDYIMKPVSLEALADRIGDMFREAPDAVQAAQAMAGWYLRRMDAPTCLGREYTVIVCGALAQMEGGGLLKEGYAEVKKACKADPVNVEKNIRQFLRMLHRQKSPGYVDFMGQEMGDRPPKNRDFLFRLSDKIREGIKRAQA